jgi:hypothetical protein
MSAVGGLGTKLAAAALGGLLAGAPASLAAPATPTVPSPRQDFLAPMLHPAVCGGEPCSGTSGASSIAVSPDGANVYVARLDPKHRGGVTTFVRDPSTGTLRREACMSEDGGAPCETPRPPTDSTTIRRTGLAVSPDGLLVALVSSRPPAPARLTTYRRNPETGLLTLAACASDRPGRTGCARAPHLGAAGRVAFGGAGRLYVLAASRVDETSGLTAFAIDAAGAPAQVSCVTEDGSDGDCVDGTGISDALDLAMSADGSSLFVVGITVGAATYAIDPVSGALTPAGCLIGSDSRLRACRHGLGAVGGIAPAPDGRMLLAAASGVVDVGQGSAGEPVVLHCYGVLRRRCAEHAGGSELGVSAAGRVFLSTFLEAGGDAMFVMEPTASGGLRVSGCTSGDLLPTIRRGCTTGLDNGATGLVASSDGENVYDLATYSKPSGPRGYALAAGVSSGTAAGRGRTRTVTVRCSSARRRCKGVARLRLVRRRSRPRDHFYEEGALLGAREFSLDPGESARVAIRLNPSARRKLSGKRQLAIGVVSDSTGLTAPTVARLVVR